MEAPTEEKDVEMYESATQQEDAVPPVLENESNHNNNDSSTSSSTSNNNSNSTSNSNSNDSNNHNDSNNNSTSNNHINRAPTSPQKRSRTSSSPESPQSDYPPGQRIRTSGGAKPELECSQCGHTFRKHSDLKKHNARHSRQYRCVEDNCPRAHTGFATINDLYRHEKSVHGKHVGKSRSYKCFAPGCAKAAKLWPRLDNFKQHLIRMHPNEELESLVRKSEQWHTDEDDGEPSQGGLSNMQDSPACKSSLQNVPRDLGSPPRTSSQSQGGALMAPRIPTTATENGVGTARWDLTPPSNPIGHGAARSFEARPFPEPLPPRPLPLNLVPNSQGTPTPAPASSSAAAAASAAVAAVAAAAAAAAEAHQPRETLQRPPHEQSPLVQQGQLPPSAPPTLTTQQKPLSPHARLPPQGQLSQQQSQLSQSDSQLPQQGQLPPHALHPASQLGAPLAPAPAPAPASTAIATSTSPAPAPAPASASAATTAATATTIPTSAVSPDVLPAQVHVAGSATGPALGLASETTTAPHREVGPRPEQLARVIHKTEEAPGPVLQPDDTREISRAAEVRELAPEASCLSCQHYNRRCYMDQSNPWQCVACPSPQHCIFRRTVVREGPTSSFSWAELVGVQNPPRKAT